MFDVKSIPLWVYELFGDPENLEHTREMVHTDICAEKNYPNDINIDNCICGLSQLRKRFRME